MKYQLLISRAHSSFFYLHGADIYHTDNQDHDVLFCADDHVRDYVLSKYNIDV